MLFIYLFNSNIIKNVAYNQALKSTYYNTVNKYLKEQMFNYSFKKNILYALPYSKNYNKIKVYS